MFHKSIATGLVAFLAAASAVNSVVVPQSLAELDVTDSTVDSLTLAVQVTLAIDAEDAGRTVDFTFGSADGTENLGSGSLVIPADAPAGTLTLAATGTYNPSTPSAKAAGEAVLSNYAANLPGAISVVAEDGTFLDVPLAAPGVEIVQRLLFWVDLPTIIAQRGNVQLQIFNAFSVPLTFTSLTASAVTPLVGNAITRFGQITQVPLPTPIVIPAKSLATSGNVTAAVTLTLAQGLNLLSRLAGGASISVTSNATAAILVGLYETSVTLNNKVIPGSRATL